jgi:PAS domain-containing protein
VTDQLPNYWDGEADTLSGQEAAAQLGVNRSALWQLVDRGFLIRVDHGDRRIHVTTHSVENQRRLRQRGGAGGSGVGQSGRPNRRADRIKVIETLIDIGLLHPTSVGKAWRKSIR